MRLVILIFSTFLITLPVARAMASPKCPIVSPHPLAKSDYQPKWYCIKDTATKGVVLILPGLNLKASVMNEMAQSLQQRQYEVLVWTLPGHFGLGEHEGEVNSIQILESVKRAYQSASLRAQEIKRPIYFLGYSFGALAGLFAETQDKDIRYHSKVLIAPAFQVHTYVNLIKLSFVFLDRIPSQNLASYQANTFTSVDLYKTLFQMQEAVLNTSAEIAQGLHPKSLIIMDPNDELVSLKKLMTFESQQRIKTWKYFKVDNSRAILNKYHHLIVDTQTIPTDTWHDIIKLVESTFE
jgi:esterase/lipase